MSTIGRFEPHIVENEMGFPELQLRFLDCLKLLKRQQQMQAITLIGAVGSFVVSKGQKTIFEEIETEIEKIASITEIREQRNPIEDKIRQAKRIKEAYELREAFFKNRGKNPGKEI